MVSDPPQYSSFSPSAFLLPSPLLHRGPALHPPITRKGQKKGWKRGGRSRREKFLQFEFITIYPHLDFGSKTKREEKKKVKEEEKGLTLPPAVVVANKSFAAEGDTGRKNGCRIERGRVAINET